MSSRPIQVIAGIVVALVLFAAGFYLGTTRAAAQNASAGASPSPSATTGRGGQQAGGAGALANRGVVSGQIISVNADSITIQVRQAGQAGASPTVSSQIALVGPSTRVVRTAETDIKLSDLKAGDQITVAGTPDTSNGTISAQAVILGGANILGDILGGGAGGPGGARPSGSPRPSPTTR
ncbi:MAG TPA: hypothetical protein VF998_04315 [Candidatus Limnocylindria bacterium]